jgi:hypothetical protein
MLYNKLDMFDSDHLRIFFSMPDQVRTRSIAGREERIIDWGRNQTIVSHFFQPDSELKIWMMLTMHSGYSEPP